MSMPTTKDRARENRLRRKAARQGLRMRGSGRHDPDVLEYGKFKLLDSQDQVVLNDGSGEFITLDQIEAFLYKNERRVQT